MVISCFSFTEAAKRAAALMPKGGAMLTLTYNGGSRAHAELQCHGRRQGRARSHRCAIWPPISAPAAFASMRFRPGPIRTLAGAGIADARAMFAFQQRAFAVASHASRSTRLGGSALYLLSDLSAGVTGEIHFVDAGYNIMLQRPEDLNGGGE